MLVSEQTNSSPVKKNSTFMETVQDKLKDIKIFSNWSAKEKMIAVGAVGMMVGPLVLFVAAALPFAATGAIVALTLFFAVKAVEYTFKGLKWSAEKTVDGAKYIGGKIKDGAVHAKDSVKEAVSSVGQATREGTSSALRAMGDGVQKFGRKMSNSGVSMSSLDSIPYSIGNEGQTVVLKTEKKTRNFNSVKEMFIKEVLEDKAVNSSALTKEIFSKLGEKILEKAYSVDGQSGFQKDQLINRLKQQVDFVNKLDAKKLQNLLSKDNNSLYEIFSDHHDEIKRIVKECKIEHKLSNSVENLNKVAGKYGIRKGATQSIENSLSRSSSLDSVRTDSTISSEAELLNPAKHKKVKQSSGFFSRFKRNEPLKEATDIKYQAFSEPDTLSRQVGGSAFYVAPPKPPRSNSLNSIGTVSTATVSSSGSKDFATVSPNRLSRSSSFSGYDSPKLTPVDPPKLSRSSSTDSGFNSSTSSPAHTRFANEDGKVKTQADLNPTSHTLWEKPSTKVDEVKPESTQVKTVG
ncbi:hypothetical protein H9I48_00170 [Wolbachia pipientis]|uniref:actin-bundling T4SS effector WalE1 family protein n=1 Tax=Wolbachia pipientis TaxID=955 RepID=UPI001650D60E|nr:hypothetical protein [Wolbachia pipientis]MBC6685689.1 hypothetical protein [Wolbachia pipientis]